MRNKSEMLFKDRAIEMDSRKTVNVYAESSLIQLLLETVSRQP